MTRLHHQCGMSVVFVLSLAFIADFAHAYQTSSIAESWWAFRKPSHEVVPRIAKTSAARNPIDSFVLSELHRRALKPVARADKRTLIRRAYFDLIGLPPSPEEVQRFLNDGSPNAYERLIDELLASPLYGERWGRHWMDVIRYADTAGDNADYPIPEARLYRDYIIDSFNADKPYDQFVREQIAGDILARNGPREKYAEQLVATGFLALSRRYGTGPYELWHLTMEDTIETTGRTFLGLTLRCARCHDHKFDPTTREDYYALYGIFASTQFPWAGSEEVASKNFDRMNFVSLASPKDAATKLQAHVDRCHKLEQEIALTEKDHPLARRVAELNMIIAGREKATNSGGTQTDAAELDALRKERSETQRQLETKLSSLRHQLRNLRKPGLPDDLPGAYAVQEGKPTDAYVQLRGEVDAHGPTVKRNIPHFLGGDQPLAIAEGGSGRLELATWLSSSNNPLTTRVMVNRIWQHHFGKGIVGTPSNFGIRGEEPTHPELLDWLANQFIKSGWSIKSMHRLIMTSHIYQLSSAHDSMNAAKDPSNKWYWRHDRRRLDAECIRDAMLHMGGKLDLTRPGPHPFPPIAEWSWTQHTPFKEIYVTNHRSVYLMTQRFQRHPYLALFDGPDTNTTTELRRESTVPLQALFLMNNAFVTEQSDGFARSLIAFSKDKKLRIVQAYEIALARPPLEEEMAKAQKYIANYEAMLLSQSVQLDRIEIESWTSFARIMLSSNEFVYID